MENATTTVEHFSEINSTDEANEAVFSNNMALRIQPPAPAATLYYFIHEKKGWVRKKAGLDTVVSVDVDTVRSAVKRAIPKNDRMDGGGVRAVEKTKM